MLLLLLLFFSHLCFVFCAIVNFLQTNLSGLIAVLIMECVSGYTVGVCVYLFVESKSQN